MSKGQDPSQPPADVKANHIDIHGSLGGIVDMAADVISRKIPDDKFFKPPEEIPGLSEIQRKRHNTKSVCKARNETVIEAHRTKINNKNAPNSKDNDNEIVHCVNREYKTTNCPQCGQEVYRSRFKTHMKAHDQKTRKCKVCSKQFSSHEQFMYHAMTHKMFDSSRCQGCKTAFSSPDRLNKHMLNSTRKSRYNCSQCKKKFKFRCELSRHMVKHSRFVCSFCKKKFVHEHRLKAHAVVHSDKRPFGCDICKKSFKSRYVLGVHRRIHSGDKPFICDTCGKQFFQMNHLVRHKFSHIPSL